MCDSGPSRGDLLAVASFATQFETPGFVAGTWHLPASRADGVVEIGWWEADPAVVAWEQALYDHHIIDPDSDYLAEDNVAIVKRVIEEPGLVSDLDLPTLCRVITFLARAERHTEGGWYDRAFGSGMVQAATRRLGDLA